MRIMDTLHPHRPLVLYLHCIANTNVDDAIVDQETQWHIAVLFSEEAAQQACKTVDELISSESSMQVVEKVDCELETIDEATEEKDYNYVDTGKKHWPEHKIFLIAFKDSLDLDHELDFDIIDAIKAKIAAKDQNIVDQGIQSTISSFFQPASQN
ncbi:hypothetical protein BC940DRAFT_314230 [Gongronella butleri]|nr:hypothetical protein BC940DRAFT_314230 [Gongronella butleri]